MTCRPFMCDAADDCGDRHCQNHPLNQIPEWAYDDPPTLDLMLLLTALSGLLAVLCIVGAFGYFVYTVAPVVIAAFQ